MKAREALLGQTNLPTWVFLGIGQVLPPGWDSERILLRQHPPACGLDPHPLARHHEHQDVRRRAHRVHLSSLDLDSADVYLSVHEEMDGLGDVHGTPEEFRAFYAKSPRSQRILRAKS